MIAYLVANAYFTGLMVGDKFGMYSDLKSGIKPVAFLLFLSLGSAIMAISYLAYFVKSVYRWLNQMFQVEFFFAYWFSKEFNNMKPEALKSINRISVNVRNTDSLRDRVYRYGIKLINDRNNFNPDSMEEKDLKL